MNPIKFFYIAIISFSFVANANSNFNSRIVAHSVVSFEEMVRKASNKPKTNETVTLREVSIGTIDHKKLELTDLPFNKNNKLKKKIIEQETQNIYEPVSLQNDFLAMPDEAANNSFHIPPDTMGAAGTYHLMTVLNSHVRIQNKDGAVIYTLPLNDFWSNVNGGGGGFAGTFDPKIIYDHGANRFIFVACDDSRRAGSGILLGVSASSIPTGNWYLWKIDADTTDIHWADFPSPGFNSKWIAVSLNMLAISNNAFTESKMWIIDKTKAYNNNLDVINVLDGSDFGDAFTVAPCKTFGDETNLYALSSGWSFLGNDFISYGQISGELNSPVWDLKGGVIVPDTDRPFAGPQLGGIKTIETGDDRITSPPVFRHGRIYFNYCGRMLYPSRNVIVWGEYDAASGLIINTGVVQNVSPPMYYGFPSIAVNSKTNIVMGFSGFSTGIYASSFFAGREEADDANTMQPVQLLKAGEDYYYRTITGSSRNRWGDYSATCLDPTDDDVFWTIQEYAMQDVGEGYKDDRWGTWWGEISFVPEPFGFLFFSFIFLILFRRM